MRGGGAADGVGKGCLKGQENGVRPEFAQAEKLFIALDRDGDVRMELLAGKGVAGVGPAAEVRGGLEDKFFLLTGCGKCSRNDRAATQCAS